MPHALLLCLLMTLSSGADALNLKIATIAPDGTSWMQEMRNGAEEVTRRTQGRVRFRFYPGGVMGNDKSVLRKIRIGQLHGGALTGTGLAIIYPDTQVYGLPFAFRSYDEVDYAREAMDNLMLDGLKQRGFVGLGIIEGGFAYLMSNQPIRNASQLKSRKVWIPEGDRISRAAFEAIGVSPVPLPLTDVLTGLQTGLIDTAASSPIGAIALQWHTRVKTMTDAPLMYLYGALVVQRKTFEKLSAQDQGILLEVMGRVSSELSSRDRKDNGGARTALQNQGIEFVRPSDQEVADLHDTVAPTVDRLVQEGVYTLEMLQTLRGLLNGYRRKLGEAR